MKKIKLVMIAATLGLSIIYSCSKNEVVENTSGEPQKNFIVAPQVQSYYNTLYTETKADLNGITNELLSIPSWTDNQGNVIISAQNYYANTNNINRLAAFLDVYEDIANNPQTFNDGIQSLPTSDLKEWMVNVSIGLESSESPDDFLTILDNSLQDVLNNDNYSFDEKMEYIGHAISLRIGVEFLEDHQKLRAASWWDSWGKCAAGTEALAGCGIGAAAGLGVASIPECGVGAIAGGVFGGLTGAAIFC